MSDARGLPEPSTPEGRDGLATIVADPRQAVVALDFDGTLAPIVDDPTAARAHPGAVPALRRLAPLVSAVVVVTGRPAATAAEYAHLAGLPGNVTVLGHYGWERWHAATGEVTAPALPEGLSRVRAELPALLTGEPGAWVEDKQLSVAVHTRRAGDPEGALQRLRDPLTELAQRCDLTVEAGRMVLELRPPGTDKGAALQAFAVERHAGAVLFAGDDLGDLPAFDAVAMLRRGGVAGVAVCSSSAEVTELAARADLVVDGPGGVVALLEGLADAVGTRS